MLSSVYQVYRVLKAHRIVSCEDYFLIDLIQVKDFYSCYSILFIRAILCLLTAILILFKGIGVFQQNIKMDLILNKGFLDTVFIAL